MNNRLDFINKFTNDEQAISEMIAYRKLFIELDKQLRDEYAYATALNSAALGRSLANARTRLEEALQHTIKALCLKHEAE